MVSLSILGMPGWVNPFCLAVRRPGTLSLARRRSYGRFFCGKPGSFDLWGRRRGRGGSRWSDAACAAPGRHTRHPQDRTLRLQEPWGRRDRGTPRPSTRWQTSWRGRRGTASEERATHAPSAGMRVCAWQGGALGEARRQESAKNVVESASAPAGVLAGTRRVVAHAVGSRSVHPDQRKHSAPGGVEVAMGPPAGAARLRWALPAQDRHGRGAPPHGLDARRRMPSIHAAVSRPSDVASRQAIRRRRLPSMERQTRSPAASSTLEAAIAVLRSPWLALALQCCWTRAPCSPAVWSRRSPDAPIPHAPRPARWRPSSAGRPGNGRPHLSRRGAPEPRGNAAAAAPGATARGGVRAAMWRSHEREALNVSPVGNRPEGRPPDHGGPP